MGLDTSHGCWRGAYSAFHAWRRKIAELVGIPLPLMAGFYRADEMQTRKNQASAALGREGGLLRHWFEFDAEPYLPIAWESLRPDPLHALLHHSDCEGEIAPEDCGPIADRLEALMPEMEAIPDASGHIGNWAIKTRKFIDGLRLAASRGEAVDFH
jgi:hypothetical protein